MFRITFSVLDEDRQVLTETAMEGRMGDIEAEQEMLCRVQLKVGALLEQIRTAGVAADGPPGRD
jgi:hypothetical protein